MRKIELTRGKHAIVDDEDYDALLSYNWYAWPGKMTFYAASTSKNSSSTAGATVRMHRLLINAKAGQIVDHINGDGLDNRKCNLRIVSSKENGRNRRPRNGLLYKGVQKVRAGKYRARIGSGKKPIHLGYFATAELAAAAYDKAAVIMYGQYAYLNLNKGNK